MTIAYLNGDYLPLEEARISPLDRGFLFGDGIYEVIPTYQSKAVGFHEHMARMANGLAALEINSGLSEQDFSALLQQLIERNLEAIPSANIGVYLHVSRGADSKRYHAYPQGITATVFGFAFEIPPPPVHDKQAVKGISVSLTEDLRWQRCHIKSTALLGNVMHFQQGYAQGRQETILYNEKQELTEASSCNVFVVHNGVIKTPPLDNQLLPGITRQLALKAFRAEGIAVEETIITLDMLSECTEVWLTSSTKEIAPVLSIEGKPVGNGEVGDMWLTAIKAYDKHKFSA